MNGALPSAAVRAILFLLICVFLGQGGCLSVSDGSLPYSNGHLYGVEENTLYANKGTRSEPKVYAVAEYHDPAGFVSKRSDDIYTANEVTMICRGYEVTRAEETGDGLSCINVTAAAKTPAELMETVVPYYTRTNKDGSTVVPVQLEGISENGLRFMGLYDTAGNTHEGVYSRSLICYVEANHGCCILVMPNFEAESEDLLPSPEYMLELTKTVITGLTIR